MDQQVIDLMAEGDSKEAVAARLGITKQTFYCWVDPESDQYHESFSDSVKQGESLSQLWWEDKLKDAAVGSNKDANATLMIFNMKNRFRNNWNDMNITENRHTFVVADEPESSSDEWLEKHKPE